MKTPTRLVVLTIECLALALCFGRVSAAPRTSGEPASLPAASACFESRGTWIVERSDNICGLDDPKMLSRPARVDYDGLLRSTPEMQKMREEKIDPNSSEGIQLREAAVDRVRRACEKVRTANGHCSVWKQIRHTEGKGAPDITELVKKEL